MNAPYQCFDMLQDKRVRIIQLVQSDVNHQIFLGKRHILIHLQKRCEMLMISRNSYVYLKCVKEVPYFTQIVQELIDAGFVVLDERIESHHVDFLGIGRFVCQILQHLSNLNRY